jgi:hypothetical protein
VRVLLAFHATSPAALVPHVLRHLARPSDPATIARAVRLPAAAGRLRETAAAVCEVADLLAAHLVLTTNEIGYSSRGTVDRLILHIEGPRGCG